jgi:hypothetical protein
LNSKTLIWLFVHFYCAIAAVHDYLLHNPDDFDDKIFDTDQPYDLFATWLFDRVIFCGRKHLFSTFLFPIYFSWLADMIFDNNTLVPLLIWDSCGFFYRNVDSKNSLP